MKNQIVLTIKIRAYANFKGIKGRAKKDWI